MGMKARMERDLHDTQQILETWARSPIGRRYLKRRIHLLEFVLSGRYAELQGRNDWHRYANVRPDPNHSCERGMDCPLYWRGYGL